LSERAVIDFSQPTDSETTFDFYNTIGELVYSKTKLYKKGIHKLKVERNEIKASGMIYLIVSNDNTSSEFKMMNID
jgi:hypothetical protein